MSGDENKSTNTGAPKSAPKLPLEIKLDAGRGRHALEAALAFGGAYVAFQMSQVVGLVLCAFLLFLGVRAGVPFIQGLRRSPGRFRIDSGRVHLPQGLFAPEATELPIERVRRAYILRRSTPWYRFGSVLCVETDERIHEYPRDWFLDEQDARKIARAICHARGILG